MKALVHYRPRTLGFFDRWDKVLDSFFDDQRYEYNRLPSVDVREDDKAYHLEAELPGMTEKDIEVKVEENLLTISGKNEAGKEEKKNGYVIRERKSASFNRSFVLPKDVNKDNIKAEFKNGLLTLTIEKSPKAQPKMIEVKEA